jgi:hypothetical protein
MNSRPKPPALSRFKFPVVLADKSKIELEKYATDKDRARDSVRGFIAREYPGSRFADESEAVPAAKP